MRWRVLGCVVALLLLTLIAALAQLPEKVTRAAFDAIPKIEAFLDHRPHRVALLLVLISFIDVVPIIGHLSAKPMQYALCWIFSYKVAAIMLAGCITSSLMLEFALGRFLLFKYVRRQLRDSKIFQAIDTAFSSTSKGLQIVVLCRLNPMLPEVLTSYAISVTAISTRHYIAGVAVEVCKLVPLNLWIAYNLEQAVDAVHTSEQVNGSALLRVALGFGVLFVTIAIMGMIINREWEKLVGEDSARPWYERGKTISYRKIVSGTGEGGKDWWISPTTSRRNSPRSSLH